MDKKEFERLYAILNKAGDSNLKSREAVLGFHGNVEDMRKLSELWASHHGVIAISSDGIFLAYATAVELGYRIALNEKENVRKA